MAEGPTKRVQAFFDQAAALAPEAREAFLNAACPDPTVRVEVERLLAFDANYPDTRTGGLLKSPVVRGPREPVADPGGDSVPAQVGQYRILRSLGAGGMGVVYLAEQLDPPRTVALKVLAPVDRTAGAGQRLRVEAESIARLQHPHIVEIFAVEEDDGRAFLVLEYLDGGSLEDRLRGGPLTTVETAGLVETLARTIHYAHCQGVVHRDLKPGNILFARDGAVKIADFGLALATGNRADLTHTGQILGTPAYMAPEQAQGDRPRVGPATDVYALGVILYECLTGIRPFRGESPLEIMRALVDLDPVPPGRHRSGLPRDVEAICLTCLRKNPEHRYPSASELAEDLDRFRTGRPTRARPLGTVGRAGRWCARRPVPAGLLATLVVVLVASFALITWKWREADDNRLTAEGKTAEEARARREAERLRSDLARESSLAMLRLGLRQAQDGFVADGMHWLARALAVAEENGFSDHERVIRLNLAHWDRRLITPRTHRLQERPVAAATASPDGRWVVTAGKDDPGGILWDLDRGDAPGLRLNAEVQTVFFSRDSSVVMAVVRPEASQNEVRLWRRRQGVRGEEPAFEPWGEPVRPGATVLELFLAPDRETLLAHVVAEGVPSVQVWDTALRTQRCPPVRGVVSNKFVGAVALDGETFLTLLPGDAVGRWRLKTGEPVGAPRTFRPTDATVADTREPASLRSLSPDGRTLAVSFSKTEKSATRSHIRVWDLQTGRSLPSSPTVPLAVRSLVFSPDSRVLAVSRAAGPGRKGDTQLYDVGTGQALGPPLAGVDRVDSRWFGPDGRALAGPDRNSGVRLWEVATGQELARESAWDGTPDNREVVFGRRVVAVSVSGEVTIWEPPSGLLRWSPVPAPAEWGAPVATATLGPDGRSVAVNPFLKTVQVWDLDTGRAVTPPLAHENVVTSVAFTPNGKALLTRCRDGSLALWEVPSGRRLEPPVRPPVLTPNSREFGAELSPDGRTLLTFGGPGARFWDFGTGDALGADLPHSGRVRGGAFSRADQRAATFGADSVTRVWDSRSGRLLGGMPQSSEVLAVVFHPDRNEVLIGGGDGIARLWEPGADTPWRSWAHRAPVNRVAFSPDGRTCATGTAAPDGKVRLWDRETGFPIGPAVGPPGDPAHVRWMEFTHDGRRLVTGGVGSTLPRIWELPGPVTGTAREVRAWVRDRTNKDIDSGGSLIALPGAAGPRP